MGLLGKKWAIIPTFDTSWNVHGTSSVWIKGKTCGMPPKGAGKPSGLRIRSTPPETPNGMFCRGILFSVPHQPWCWQTCVFGIRWPQMWVIKGWTGRWRQKGNVDLRNRAERCCRWRGKLYTLSHERFWLLAYPILFTVLWRKTSEVWYNPSAGFCSGIHFQ